MPFTPQQWRLVTRLFARSDLTCLHAALATVGHDGAPHVAPVGSLVLLDNGTGLFFDAFLGTTERNLRHDPRFTVLAVDAGKGRWLRALATGRFATLPAIRLSGVAGPRREATTQELELFRRRVRWARRLKGHDLLWSRLRFVHDVTFEAARLVRLGALATGLWPEDRPTPSAEASRTVVPDTPTTTRPAPSTATRSPIANTFRGRFTLPS